MQEVYTQLCMSTSLVFPPSFCLLITGAAGLIGSCLVRFLNDLGVTRLVLVDNMREGEKWKNLVGKKFLEILPKQHLWEWLEKKGSGIDAVCHLGACSSTLETDGDYLLENNYRYTIRLAEWALAKGKRFVYASSAATYGDGKLGFSDREDLLPSLRPLNMYGYSKHLVDLWMQQEGVLHKVVGLKYFNVFGPNEYHKGPMASMVLKMGEKVEKEGVIRLYQSNDLKHYQDGEQRRDFLYVKDAVAMTSHFLAPSGHKMGGIFNLGRGEAVTWNRLARALFRSMKREEKIEYIAMPEELSRQYQNYTCAAMEKYEMAFAPFPFTSIEEAVEDYVVHYLQEGKRW